MGQQAKKQLQLAVTVLLWDMAYIDGSRNPEEFAEIVRSIDGEFHLMDEETGQLLGAADLYREHQDQLEKALQDITKSYDLVQREHICDMLTKVALADGEIGLAEQQFLTYIRERLDLVK
ncbi:MAG: TerB family tellurite resistance protein [Bdellovibrionales bacterium]|nr:TerB family tellurite resistance protein [Bdellovibrionales bacterium]